MREKGTAMRLWRATVLSIAATAIAGSLAAQTPVLSSAEAPYAALQNSQPIKLAGNSYSAGQVAYGPVGTPLVLSGSNLGEDGVVWFVGYKKGAVDQNTASVQASVTMWTPTAVILTVPAGAVSGLVKVVTAGKASNGLPFMVMNGTYSGNCPAVPAQTQLQIQTTSLQDGAVSQSYSATLQAIGGSSSYTWSLVSGSLPAGLTLSTSGNNGIISGTPSAASGPVSITVQVADTSSPQKHDAATLSIQIAGQTEAASSAALYRFAIVNASGGSGYDGVGNVSAYTDSVNGTWSFNYDTLNRLANATGAQADNPYPNFCWQYDSFGNRLWQSGSATPYASTAGGPNTCPVMAGPSSWATYNVSNTNRMDATSQNVNQSQYYDPSGNITNDGITAYLYDGEGRICAVQQQIPGIGTAMTQYLYDADGTRVAKGSISTWSCDTAVNGFTPQSAYVLGPHGEQLTEMTYMNGGWQWAHTNVMAPGLSATYDADLSGTTSGPLYFHLSDWLGTRRQQTDFAGNPLLNFTGLPFGDGLATIPVSNTDAADATEHHFTGKERDSESGNDYFGARYYASTMGRFLSPDPMGGSLANPQSLNKYAYALSNPLVNTDPTGLYVCEDSTDCSSDNDKKFAQNLSDARNAAWNLSGADLLNAMNAINSYGDQGVDNGVNVRFDSSITDGQGNPLAGVTEVSGIANGQNDSQNDNPNKQNINVTFNPDQLAGAVGAGLVAHEGSHVADGSAWVSSGFSAAKDPTSMETEFNAYHVQFNVVNTLLRQGWSGNGFPPTFTLSGSKGSASWFATDSWNPVDSHQVNSFIKANYSNLNSAAFTRGAVVPR
jgi:RHS repeat-associated protein